MKLLLDTHILLWASLFPERLSRKVRDEINDAENDLLFSTGSIWEIVLKHRLRRSTFHVDARVLRRSLLDNQYTELPINSEHVIAVESLPAIHKDPFDRLLVAQATVEGITLLTADSLVAKYPGPIRAV